MFLRPYQLFGKLVESCPHIGCMGKRNGFGGRYQQTLFAHSVGVVLADNTERCLDEMYRYKEMRKCSRQECMRRDLSVQICSHIQHLM